MRKTSIALLVTIAAGCGTVPRSPSPAPPPAVGIVSPPTESPLAALEQPE